MKDSILLIKSKAFALRIVRLYKYLRERKESVIAKQMLRSGTSIGANIAEKAYGCQTAIVFNHASLLHGCQIALINFADECEWGFQIGLINVIMSNKLKVLPIVNGYF